MKLCGKRYLITGGSSGLGLAIIKQLIKFKGTKITAVARNINPLYKLQTSRVFPLSLDISKPENIETMLDETIANMGGIDCVITCAGFGYYGRFCDKGYKHIEQIFNTNILSPLFTLERLLAKTNNKISFVVISSLLGEFGLPGMALYSATKHALKGFHDSYRFEKPKRLHYMTAYPIGLNTNFWEKIAPDIPRPRPLQSADAAAYAIIEGLRKQKKTIYTSFASKLALRVNQVIPILIPAYQQIYKYKFNKWSENHHSAHFKAQR